MTFSFIENPAASYFIQNKDQVNEKSGTHHLDQHDNTDTDFIKLTKKHNVKHKAVDDGTKMTGHPDNIKKVLSVMPNHDPSDFKEAKLDPVDPDELKGKLKDRKDKDIDNDGDVDKTDKYLHKRRKAISKKSSTEDEPEGDNGEETAIMNPKMKGNKKGSEMEAKESRIRTALNTVLERGPGHGHMNNRDSWDEKLKGKGAKDMAADAKAGNPDIDTTRKLSLSDAEAAQKAGPRRAKARPGDSQIGDKNIVKPGTPMVDPAAPKARALESVSTDWYSTKKSTESIAAAYKSMYDNVPVTEATAKVDYFTGHKHAEKAGINVKVHGPNWMGGDDVTLSHSDPAKLHKYCDNHCGGEEQGVVVKHNGKTWSPK